MMTRFSIQYLAVVIFLISCSQEKQKEAFGLQLGKVPAGAIFKSDNMSVWGASLVKGPDGLYHLYYSQWPKRLGWAWVTHSEIAHAVGKSPFGPFEFHDITLPARGGTFWDGLCTHNPTIHKFGDKYYLYYMGNTGDGKVVGTPGKPKLNWMHRNNQRIGVAVADNPNGPWTRFDKPIIDISPDSTSIDALMTSNPSVTQRPDGGYLMIYKAVGKKFSLPQGGPVVHAIATADKPEGPFVKYGKPIFTVKGDRFPAEDPYVWYQDGAYRAIVKRMTKTENRGRVFSLQLYESEDGYDWKMAKHNMVSTLQFSWFDGRVQKVDHLERPQLFIENGMPKVLLCAADTIDDHGVRHSFNVQIPLESKEFMDFK